MPGTAKIKSITGKGQKQRNQIRAVAAHIFALRGYHGASMQQVATELDVNKATIYHYYKSKEEILFDILTYSDVELMKIMELAVKDVSNPLEAVHNLYSVFVTWYLHHPDIAKVAIRDWSELSGDFLKIQEERRYKYRRMQYEAIERCRAEGFMAADANIDLLLGFIYGACEASIVSCSPDAPETPEYIGQAYGFMIKSLIKDYGRGSNAAVTGSQIMRVAAPIKKQRRKKMSPNR